jgi:hypothetical protein
MPVIGDAAMLRQKYSFAEGLKGLIVDYTDGALLISFRGVQLCMYPHIMQNTKFWRRLL